MRMPEIERRTHPGAGLKVGVAAASVTVGLLAGGVVLAVSGVDVPGVFAAIARGAFGSTYDLSETTVIAVPILLCASGLALVFRMRFVNVGAKGQYILGAIASTGLALHAPESTPRVLLLSGMALAGMVAGASWALLPAILKVRARVDEVITTLLLNYVAQHLLSFFLFGPWRDPESHGFPLTRSFAMNAQLPRLFAAPSRVHLGSLLALAAAAAVWVVLKRSRFGFEARVIGESEAAAHYAGIPAGRDVAIAACVSGALAGLAGMVHTSGVLHLLQNEIGSDCGYTAIIVAWLAGLHPLVAIPVAFLLAALEAGGYQVQMALRVPFGIVGVIEASILIALLAGELLHRYRLVWRNP
jgi:general nucleoside transport system permease protein